MGLNPIGVTNTQNHNSITIIMDITERFINYTKFNTQSSEDSESVPSTAKQLIFAEYLKKELEDEGLSDVENGRDGIHLCHTESQYEERDANNRFSSRIMIRVPIVAVPTSKPAS
jgi:hypothetical protein